MADSTEQFVDNGETDAELPRILLVDDEDRFRLPLARQLTARGYAVQEVGSGEEAIRAVRHGRPEVIVLDQRMPKMDGIQTLVEVKRIAPEVQAIMLTGFGSIESARLSGKHDIFDYLQKPCDLDVLIETIERARQEYLYAKARHEIPHTPRTSPWKRLMGAQNARPGVILLGALIFLGVLLSPTPERMETILTMPKVSGDSAIIYGYSGYAKMKEGETIPEYYSRKDGVGKKTQNAKGDIETVPLTPKETAWRAKVMIGTLIIAALFWATGAMPIGITALLVGAMMYLFGVLPPDGVAKAYAKDAVIFIFGVLALSVAITRTGLDRRIGILLLGISSTPARLAFVFCPMLAVTASFLSEHALVAFLAPVFMLVYLAAIRSAGIVKDRSLIVMLMLMLTFTANVGGPGSPAAGGRNAIMIGILGDYGEAPTFGEWVLYGLPFVPVMALVIGAYFYFTLGRRLKVPKLNAAQLVRREAEKIGPMTRDEYVTAGVLIILVVLWITTSRYLGMGGPVILCLVLLNILGILRWRHVNSIHWDVVALYASASALGVGLANTGAALWIADVFIQTLPDFLRQGEGLAIASSLFTGILTNIMSDGATVAAMGPITVPMATLADTPPLMVGLATAFASSFAHMLVIGTPNNAIVYSLARDPNTGEQLLTLRDFLVHGFAVVVLSFIVLWFWVFYGYWRWIGF